MVRAEVKSSIENIFGTESWLAEYVLVAHEEIAVDAPAGRYEAQVEV